MKSTNKKPDQDNTKKLKSKSNSQGSGTSSSRGHEALRGLFVDQLKDIYWAEKALMKAIPKMIKNATSDELVDALTDHLEVTKTQIERLEEVFGVIGQKAAAVKCDAMVGLIKESESIMSETEKGMLRDSGIIAAAQKVEHYEIATYGTLCSLAKNLHENEAASLLHETLEEEKEADEKLTEVAESVMQSETADYDDEDSDTVTVSKKKKK